MKFCSNCGHMLEDSANFCSNCGKAVNSDPVYDYEPEDLDVGYRVVLISRGSCSVSNAKELLSDLLGYSSSTAKDLLDEAPVEIADELTEKQAVVLAQALAEYGMEITIVDENNTFVDFSSKATSSVFDKTGALIATALATLASLTAINRVHRYRRYKKPSLLSLLFKPTYKQKKPVHVRRHVSRDPEPTRRIQVNRPKTLKDTLHTGKPNKKDPVGNSNHRPSQSRPHNGRR